MSSQKSFVWFEAKSTYVVQKFSTVVEGFVRCTIDHSLFFRKSSRGYEFLVVYVHDILLIGSDSTGISETTKCLKTHFITNDMAKLQFFLGIEFAYAWKRMTLSQQKYALETRLLGCKLENTLIKYMSHVLDSSSKVLENLNSTNI